MSDEDKALVERLERIVFITEGEEISDAISRIKAQAAEIEYWKTEARNVRRELKSEQKRADNAMDNYDAIHRRCEAQAAEIKKLREALHAPLAFIEALHENDPDDQIADNGMTVLDGLKQQAPSVIKTIRAAIEAKEHLK